MGVTVSTDWKYRDLQTVIAENELIRIIIIPELGAKIWQIEYKPAAKQLLWNHPRIKPRKIPFHSVYDDVFYGGWDELFPNDMIEDINGEKLHDHGEVWALPWEYTITKATREEAEIYMWVETSIISSRMDKWITLKAGEPNLRVKYRITNTGMQEQPFLWKLHAAVAVDEHCRIDLGAQTMYIEDFGPPRNNRTGIYYDWPYAADDSGNSYDMRNVLPAASAVNEFQYATKLNAGWCAVTHTKDKIGFGLAFDHNILRSCWLFSTFGGWRNLNTVILEPCTGYPISVNEGLERGTHQTLKAGESMECGVIAVVYDGITEVSHIDHEGNVTS